MHDKIKINKLIFEVLGGGWEEAFKRSDTTPLPPER